MSLLGSRIVGATGINVRTRKRPVNRLQMENEKKRISAPVQRTTGMLWKELENSIVKIMQEYCGDAKHEEKIKNGRKWLADLSDSEAKRVKTNA
jgi:succinate dehydrogenase/fumarate reductase flavoprotein subunit